MVIAVQIMKRLKSKNIFGWYRMKAGQRCRFARRSLLRAECISKQRHQGFFKVLRDSTPIMMMMFSEFNSEVSLLQPVFVVANDTKLLQQVNNKDVLRETLIPDNKP